jgi:hypothetical protein
MKSSRLGLIGSAWFAYEISAGWGESSRGTGAGARSGGVTPHFAEWPLIPSAAPVGRGRLRGGAGIAEGLHGISPARVLLLPFSQLAGQRRFFLDRIDISEARDDLKRLVAGREERFLAVARECVFDRPASPYARLLRHAGCEFGDLQESVRRRGLENTLRDLAEEGVYLTSAEFKGKREVVRGRLRFRMTPLDAALPRSGAGWLTQSSGSSNRPMRALASFDWLRADTATIGTFIAAHGLQDHHHAILAPPLPGMGGVMFAIMLARLGIPCERWFARDVPYNNRLEAMYAAMLARGLALVGSWSGPGFAPPEKVSADGLGPIVRWVEQTRARGEKCCVRSVASGSVAIARTAMEMGVSLEGLTLISSGEPMTPAKKRVIDQSGARTVVAYGYDPGTVHVGFGCADPAHLDEMHINLNTLAVVARPGPTTDYGPPLLFTTLHRSAALFQFNVENGDRGILRERDCGCPLQEAGLSVQVHRVRSHEKFTSEGLNYPVDEVLQVIEADLPAAFGGVAADYQLVEEQEEDGRTYLTLLIHPRLGSLPEAEVLDRLAEGLGTGDRGRRFMAEVWRRAGTFRSRREEPRASLRGKVLPLRLDVQRARWA